MKQPFLFLIWIFALVFSLRLPAQKLWPIEGQEGTLMVQAGPNHSEAWLGNSPSQGFIPFASGALPLPFSHNRFLALTWVDVRNLVRVYQTHAETTHSDAFICLESLADWQFKTECFDLETGKWAYAMSRDARPSILLRPAGFNSESDTRSFLQSLPCAAQDSVCRRLAMPALMALLSEMDSVALLHSHTNATEVLTLQHELQTFLERGAGKTLMDFRRTTQAQAFFSEPHETAALWKAYDRLANHYIETRNWGPALLLLNTLKRVYPGDLTIQSRIKQAEQVQ